MNPSIKRLYRTRAEANIAGICSGLGKYMEVDPIVLRLVALCATIGTGVVPGLLAYLGAWIIIPIEPTQRVVRPDPAAQTHQQPLV